MKHIRNIILLISVLVILGSCASVEVRAVRHGDLQGLEKFLSKGGDPNTVDKDGNGLIHVAVQYGQVDSLKVLLNAGANPELLNRAGNSALILAVGKNSMNMIDILLGSGADPTRTGNGGRTTLMIAAGNGNVNLMEKLLSEGVDLEAVDNSGQSALFYSVSSDSPEALLFLINSGADAGLIDNKDRTALHLLTKNEQRPIARMLIQAGADPSKIQSLTGETPLHIASGSGAWELVEEYLADKRVKQQINLLSIKTGAPLSYALNPGLSSQGAVKTMKLLLDAGADPNLRSVDDFLPIVQAVEKLDTARVDLLVKAGSKLNIRLAERKTLLHLAASRGIPELVSVLLRAGIDPDLLDQQGNTALFTALTKSGIDTMKVLLDFRADTNIINNEGETVFYIALKRDAKQKRGISKETSLLISYKALLPPGKEILSQLLLLTVNSGNPDVAEILLNDGANPNERVKGGMTLLMLSSSRSFVELSKALLREGARINMWDKSGNTAMHYASGAGSVDGVELLLSYGEDPDSENYETLRPIQLAPKNDQGDRIIEILLAAGAESLPQEAEPETVVQAEAAPLPKDEKPVVEAKDSDEVVVESDSAASSEEDNVKKDTAVEDLVIQANQEEDVKDNQSEAIKVDHEKKVEWAKAKVLFSGEKEPKKVSKERISFEGFSADVPKFYPRNLYSKSNKRKVSIYILNETEAIVEIYFVNTEGKTEAVQRISPWESINIKTQEGNIYPVYTQDDNYFGEINTTGREEQYFRLADKK